jgi:D-glycerate 3-kinase
VLFEGWCVGALPEENIALASALNALEREQDGDGRWRRFVNDSLRASYQDLFAVLDALILLKAPSFEVVYDWRLEQEHKLRDRVAVNDRATRVMSDRDIAVFISHFERITRHILSEMPARADAVVTLNDRREPLEILVRERLLALR